MKFRFTRVAVAMLLSLVASVGAFAQSDTTQSDTKGSAAASQAPKAADPAMQANPYSTFNKFGYARIKNILVSSAEKMPEENYSFKPTDAVRSYGQIVGHL